MFSLLFFSAIIDKATVFFLAVESGKRVAEPVVVGLRIAVVESIGEVVVRKQIIRIQQKISITQIFSRRSDLR
jgi:hypothetical protein